MSGPPQAALSGPPWDRQGLWWDRWAGDKVAALLLTLVDPLYAYTFEENFFGVRLERREVSLGSVIDAICLHLSGALGASERTAEVIVEPLDISQALALLEALERWVRWRNRRWWDQIRLLTERRRRRDFRRRRVERSHLGRDGGPRTHE